MRSCEDICHAGDLTAGEIVEQLVHARAITPIRNVVFMGMGVRLPACNAKSARETPQICQSLSALSSSIAGGPGLAQKCGRHYVPAST